MISSLPDQHSHLKFSCDKGVKKRQLMQEIFYHLTTTANGTGPEQNRLCATDEGFLLSRILEAQNYAGFFNSSSIFSFRIIFIKD